MRKLLVIALFVALVFSTTVAFANSVGMPGRFNQDQNIRMALFVNDSSEYVTSNQLSSENRGILVPGKHRILGFTVVGIGVNPSSENFMAFYDESGDGAIIDNNELEAEIESRSLESLTHYLPYPYKIKNGVKLRVGPRTVTTIYYEYYSR